tara:strand:- start:788 stop:1864 length:1077 start_codon:yes stop_codon:yes gene_type:complete
MKRLTCTLLATLALASPGRAVEPISPDLSKATTRALLENLSGLPPPIGGPIPEKEHLELRLPLTLTIQGGQEFKGTLSELHEGRIYLRLVQEGGEVILSFPVEEIEQIFFPGGSIVHETIEKVNAGELSEALPYLESIIGARYAFFPILAPENLSFYRALPLTALAVDNPAQAIAYIKAIRPYLTLPEDQRELDDIELLSYHRLELTEETRERALRWIDGTPERFPTSALGFYVLASLQFEAGEYDEALDSALHPIVFSGPIHQPYLKHCYSLAIVSAYILKDPIELERLTTEARERGIEWQPQMVFAAADKGLEEFIITDAEGNPLPLIPDESTEDSPLLEKRGSSNHPAPESDNTL